MAKTYSLTLTIEQMLLEIAEKALKINYAHQLQVLKKCKCRSSPPTALSLASPRLSPSSSSPLLKKLIVRE